jgi:hypothetical protein
VVAEGVKLLAALELGLQKTSGESEFREGFLELTIGSSRFPGTRAVSSAGIAGNNF